MMPTGSAWLRSPWTCCVVVLALAGTGIGNQPQDPVQVSQDQLAKQAPIAETKCPAGNLDIWALEAELFREPACAKSDLQSVSDAGAASGTSAGAETAITVDSPSAEETPRIVNPAETVTSGQDSEQDTDSLLDSSSFLSFEDWKKQNLAKAGQSVENVGGSRRVAAAGKEGRRQPGINNALDSLGDDAEIELEFGGFGAETPEASPTAWGTPIASPQADTLEGEGEVRDDVHTQRVHQADISRRKDAGTTCKERFNYASFDCAATVLKTNPECKGSSSILVENKDSYMLNECRAQNKFLILELCDDILVDTVVLANYEFFSSIFHTFRVSVSDRYPAKPDQWKELGVYEARNTREVQAFAVENSLIWARYLRIEFLTHYGHEFFCPVSLVRVHGTTMMEEYKHDESVGRGESEAIDEGEPAEVHNDVETEPPVAAIDEPVLDRAEGNGTPETCPQPLTEVELVLLGLAQKSVDTCGMNERPPADVMPEGAVRTDEPTMQPQRTNNTISTGDATPSTKSGSAVTAKGAEDNRKTGDTAKAMVTTPDASSAIAEPPQQNSTVESTGKPTGSPKEDNNPQQEVVKSTFTQPPPSSPTTQESFFKSVHKRLQMLESNSTLSLLYIEEQSRILRDAFNKVEKRQLAKTTTFLENLNVTVMNELKEFRDQYDHVWNSVALEFEHQRIRYHQELHSISAQLGVLADEVVFQKRVTIVQSIMVLCCFALVLFSRGSVSNYMEFPRVQRLSSPLSASPTASPGSTRPTSSYRENERHRRNLSESSSQDSPESPSAPYNPPTPISAVSREVMHEEKIDAPPSPESMSVPTLGTPPFRPHSTPPVMNGHSPGFEDGDAFALSEVSQTSDEASPSTP